VEPPTGGAAPPTPFIFNVPNQLATANNLNDKAVNRAAIKKRLQTADFQAAGGCRQQIFYRIVFFLYTHKPGSFSGNNKGDE